MIISLYKAYLSDSRVTNIYRSFTYQMARGVAKGGGVPGPPIQSHLKLLGIKRVRTRHALCIRLIEL